MTTAPDVHADADEAVEPRRWWTLGVLCLSLTLVMVSNASLNVALPSIARELNATSSDLQWIVDAYGLVFAGMLFAAGTLGDRFGRKGALQGGLALFLVAAALGARADTSEMVIAARATMGLGAAFVMPSTLSILTNVFPAHERARAISMWAGIAAGGAALGPPTSGFLLEHFWWGSVFLLTVPITAVALIAGHRLVPTSRDPDETRLDVPGALLSVVGIGALVYAIIEGPEAGWASAATLGTLAFAVVAIAAFFTWESHSSHPMLDLTLFRDRRFSVASAGIGLAFFTMFGIFFLITQLFQLVHGLSPLAAGLMILPMSFTLMLVSPRAASLVDRFGVDRVVPTGLATIGGALALLAGLSQLDSVWWVELALVPLATGMAITMSPLTTLIMSAVPRSRAGMGSAMNDATRELGGALGVAILGSLASTVYVSRLPTLDGFAPDAASEVRDGLAGAIANAPELSNGRPTVFLDSARDAFLGGMFVALVAAAALAFAAALAARRWLPRSAATDTTEQPTARIIGAVGGS